jgi:hypothetical protein
MKKFLLILFLLGSFIHFSFSQTNPTISRYNRIETIKTEGITDTFMNNLWLDYWQFSGEAGLNLAQTDQWNWAEGGYQHFNSIFNLKSKLIYKKNKLAWESMIDNELGVLYSSELLPTWRKSADKINFSSKFGYEVANKFFITGLITFKSQHTDSYRYPQQFPNLNEPKKLTSFLSPAYTDISLGIDWKYNEHFSIYLSPAAGLVTSCPDSLLRADYGVPVDKRSITTVGPKMKTTVNTTYKGIKIATVLELYTPYSDPDQKFGNFKVDWDLSLSYQFLKMLNFRITTSLRYNEKVKFDEYENGIDQPRTRIRRVQFKEIVGIGVVYTFTDVK